MKKLEISEKIKNEIINKFENGVAMRELERQYPYSFVFIQKLVSSYKSEKQLKLNYPIKDGFNLIAVCKKTGKEFIDYSNTCGVITKHVCNLYPEESTKSRFITKSIEYKTSKFWYDKYFDFIYKIPEVVETKKCFYCDWVTKDNKNYAGSYKTHLNIVHGITPYQHLTNNPSDKEYFKYVEPPKDAVTCEICGKKMRMINTNHLKKHNITVGKYKKKYKSPMVSETTNKKLSISAKINNRYVIRSFVSRSENEIRDFLIDNGIFIKQSERTILNGLEIDLYCPDYNIGIEYNGNLYHSENYGKKDENYHVNKSNLALNNGISLYHIHDDEWDYNREMVKAKLLHIFDIEKNFIMFKNDYNIVDNVTLYLDRRWFPSPNRNCFISQGYKCVETTLPDYWYYNPNTHISERINRSEFTKEKLKLSHPRIYNESKTEWQIMRELGYDRVWDCGKFVYKI